MRAAASEVIGVCLAPPPPPPLPPPPPFPPPLVPPPPLAADMAVGALQAQLGACSAASMALLYFIKQKSCRCGFASKGRSQHDPTRQTLSSWRRACWAPILLDARRRKQSPCLSRILTLDRLTAREAREVYRQVVGCIATGQELSAKTGQRGACWENQADVLALRPGCFSLQAALGLELAAAVQALHFLVLPWEPEPALAPPPPPVEGALWAAAACSSGKMHMQRARWFCSQLLEALKAPGM